MPLNGLPSTGNTDGTLNREPEFDHQQTRGLGDSNSLVWNYARRSRRFSYAARLLVFTRNIGKSLSPFQTLVRGFAFRRMYPHTRPTAMQTKNRPRNARPVFQNLICDRKPYAALADLTADVVFATGASYGL